MSHEQWLNDSSQPVCALILDAHLKSSLAAIRSLGAKGIPVCAGSYRHTAMGLYSRYVIRRFVYPSPLEDCSGFIDAIDKITGQLGKCALLTFSDSTLVPLVDHRRLFHDRLLDLLPGSLSDFQNAFDKGCTAELARSVAVEIPQTYFCQSAMELDEVSRRMPYPIVLKPRRTVYWQNNSGIQVTSSFAFSPEDLKVKFNHILSRTGEAPLLQEYIKGEEAGVEYLCLQGRILASCAHRRIRSASPAGGAGVVTQTVPLDYFGMQERALRLVAALQWSGPIMVEFKVCGRTGVPYLMEINGRFWGSLPLAIAAGVDFPYIYYQLACGGSVSGNINCQTGLMSRHIWGDFTNLCSALFRKDPMRYISYPSRWTAVRGFLYSFFRCTPAVFDHRDIKPSFAEAIDTIRVLNSKHLFPASVRKQVPASVPSSET